MAFNIDVVRIAVERLQDCEATKDLGVPAKLLILERTEHFGTYGVGVEWHGEIRNAVAFHGPQASENFAETKRRIEEWIAA